jgi:hypothetical protein
MLAGVNPVNIRRLEVISNFYFLFFFFQMQDQGF